MSYRNGTYIAFDGLGEKNPAKSDYKCYSTLLMQRELGNISFNDSHDKTGNMRDTSLTETKKIGIRKRLSESKHIIIFISNETRNFGSLLLYEIEQAARLELPFVIVYADVKVNYIHKKYSHFLPKILRELCDNEQINAFHVPFKIDLIKRSLEYQTIHKKLKHPGSYISFTD